MRSIKKAVALLAVLSFVIAFAPFIQAQDGAQKININTATAEELTVLKQVGAKLAQRIVQFRQEKGNFKTPEDLMKVPGVGQKIVETNKNIIAVE